MSKANTTRELVPFDAARYLTGDDAIAEYVSAVLEIGEPDLLLMALSDVARARGMAQVAQDAGLGRESLYKALAPGAKPRFRNDHESDSGAGHPDTRLSGPVKPHGRQHRRSGR